MTINRERLSPRRLRDLRVGMAQIDNLIVGDPQISGVGAAKLIAESILGNKIYVGGTNFELDGGNVYLLVKDTQGSPVTRIKLGKTGAGATDYGLKIWGSDGSLQWDLTGASTQGIQNNAVTNSASFSADGTVSNADASVWTEAGSLAITALGSLPIAVWAKGDANVATYIGDARIIHNESSTQIDWVDVNTTWVQNYGLIGIYTPGSAGTATFKLQIKTSTSGGTLTMWDRRMVAIELKR